MSRPTFILPSLIRFLQFVHRHTSFLNGFKERIGLQRVVTDALIRMSNNVDVKDVISQSPTTYVRDQVAASRRKGVAVPDVYLLAAENMGDVLACEPIGRYIKQAFAPCRLHWIVRSVFKDLIASAPYIDEVVSVSTLADGYALLKEKSARTDSISVNCHMDGSSCGKTAQIIRNDVNPRVNSFTYLHLGSLLNAFSLAAGLPLLDEDSDFYFAPEVSAPFRVPPGSIVIHCSSNGGSRDWDAKKWNHLIAFLMDKGRTVIEIGYPKTIHSNSPRYIDFTGPRNLQQIARLIQSATLYIGVESGFAHMACAIKAPSLILIGKFAHYDTYMPYSGAFVHSDKFKILHAPNGHLAKDIPEETVRAECQERLHLQH